MREIPPLSVLCLRAIGSPRCSAEDTFARTRDGTPSTASRLLRSFSKRKTILLEQKKDVMQKFQRKRGKEENTGDDFGETTTFVLEDIPLTRTPAIGSGSGRRKQANDVDLNHPWIAVYQRDDVDVAGVVEERVIEPQEPPVDKVDTTTDTADATTGQEEMETTIAVTEPPSFSALPLAGVPAQPEAEKLVAEFGSCALDLLQSYIDSLVELGRMDDNRLGLHFFQEWKAIVEASADSGGTDMESETETGSFPYSPSPAVGATAPFAFTAQAVSTGRGRGGRRGRGRGRGRGRSPYAAKRAKTVPSTATGQQLSLSPPLTCGSLSLHNAVIMNETLTAMIESKMLAHVAVLDMTGIQTLDDIMLETIVRETGPQLQRLSVKNCRRLTTISLQSLVTYAPNLVAVDLGGSYNITPTNLLEALAPRTIRRGRGVFTTYPLVNLRELDASGLGWTNESLPSLFQIRPWRALSIGFASPQTLSFGGFKDALFAETSESMCESLQSLALPFCEGLVDNALLGLMGRHLPHLRALDVRGNSSLSSLTGWYDGRATIVPRVPLQQSLVVLARFSGISKGSVEETKRIHPLAASPLIVVLDSEGIGLGILRMQDAVNIVESATGGEGDQEFEDDVVEVDREGGEE